jgi:hypothetical protein
MTEWEEIREARLKGAAAMAQAEAAAVAEAKEAIAEIAEEPEAAVIQEAEAVVAEAQRVEAQATAEPEAVVAEVAAVPAVADVDEESILEALIREEDSVLAEVETAVPEPEAGLSVDDLGSFTLDDMAVLDDEAEDEPELDVDLGELAELPVLTPDAGKIRFAEDIVEDFRGGGGRRGGRSRRGGGGARRGGGGR